MSISIGSINDFVRQQLEGASRDEARAAQIGSQLERSEEALLNLYARGEWLETESTEDRISYLQSIGLGDVVGGQEGKGAIAVPALDGIRKAAELRYQRAMRVMEGFMTILRNADQIIQRAIQNLRVG